MDEAYWRVQGVQGILSWRQNEVALEFDVECDRTGAVSIEFPKFYLSKNTRWIMETFDAGGAYAEFLKLRGTDSEGRIFDTAYLELLNFPSNRAPQSPSESMTGRTSWLEVKIPENEVKPTETTAVQFLIPGLEGFGHVETKCDLGRVRVAAESSVKDYGLISGALIFESDNCDSLEHWVEECTNKAELVLEILSLAEDRRLDWSIRDVFDHGLRSSLLFRGATDSKKPQQPLFSHLHLQPALDLAIHSYTEELRKDIGMGYAIELFLMRPRYLELQFIAAMMGLEHMLAKFSSSHSRGALVDSGIFGTAILKNLREELGRAARDVNSTQGADAPISDSVLKELSNQLGHINRAPQREVLIPFLEENKVPLEDLSKKKIRRLIQTRNDLAHGRFGDDRKGKDRLNDQVGLLQELLKRVFLSLLGYEGKRWTFLEGGDWVTFPPGDGGKTNE